MNKVRLLLVATFLIALFLPANLALAATATTVEINNGNTITLPKGGSTTGIPIDVNNIVTPAQGLAAFDLTINWDASIIRVDSLTKSNEATDSGWSFIQSINNSTGAVRLLGTTTQSPYSKADLTLVSLGITALGSEGQSTVIKLTITNLVDNSLQEITPRDPVNAQVEIKTVASLPVVSLTSLKIEPANPSLSLGGTRQFAAIGTYSDKSSADIAGIVTWTSSNQAIATIQAVGQASPGLAKGLAGGTTTITAALGKISATTPLAVTKIEENPGTSPPEQPVVPPTLSPPTSTNPPKPGETPAAPVPTGETGTTNTPPPTAPPGPPPAEPSNAAGVNWWLFGGIAAGVVILGIVSYLLLKRR